MEMDKSEIAVSFRLAKDKKAQIETLADLNLCSPYEIAKVLDEMGALQGSRLRLDMFSGKKQYRPVAGDPAYAIKRPTGMVARGRPHKALDEDRAMELWREGASDQEMMAALGATYWAVTQWRKEHGLTRYAGAKKRKNGGEAYGKAGNRRDSGRGGAGEGTTAAARGCSDHHERVSGTAYGADAAGGAQGSAADQRRVGDGDRADRDPRRAGRDTQR